MIPLGRKHQCCSFWKFITRGPTIDISVPSFVVIILLTICGTYWVIQDNTQTTQVELKPSSTILELNEALFKARAEPKIIYRCHDNEPRIVYPKHASDDMTTILMGTDDECGEREDLDAVIIVHSSATNFDKRSLLRMFNDRNVTSPYKLKIVFLIGQTLDAETQLELEKENRIHGDTVVGGFLDTYHNLTLKAVMGFRWLSKTCQGVSLVIKLDDDVVFNPHTFFQRWRTIKHRNHLLACKLNKNRKIYRTGKWAVDENLVEGAKYDYPCCTGPVVAITGDLIADMYEAAKKADFFWIDDVFMYGMVPHALEYKVGFYNFKKGVNTNETVKPCIGETECSVWAFLTSGIDMLKEGYQTMGLIGGQMKQAKNSTSIT